MDKIYTRHKFRFPTWKNRRKTRLSKIIFVITIILIILIITIKAISPVFHILCEDRAKSIATTISNEQATEVMKKYSYDNIFEIEKDDQGYIKMIKSNIFIINQITSDIALKIQKKIDERGSDNINIAMGSFTGIKLLSGWGPKVGIKISTKGNVETDLRSEFKAEGINQTIHRVYLQVNSNVSVLTPFNNIDTQIANQVLIAENVIVGNIPETFYNFNGVDQQDAGLEAMQ